jgi:hypothetical protein
MTVESRRIISPVYERKYELLYPTKFVTDSGCFTMGFSGAKWYFNGLFFYARVS